MKIEKQISGEVICTHYISIDDTEMSTYGISSHPSPRPHFSFSPAAISLLRYCRVVGYVYIFLFPVCRDYFIA